MKDSISQAVRMNLSWFLESGIMRPADGFWGVAERIVTNIEGEEPRKKINQVFPYQTKLTKDSLVLEHRRADCCFETAIMFDLASEYFKNDKYRKIAKNIVDFLIERSGLRIVDKKSKFEGLWEWAMPKFPTCWTDDNSWVIISLLFLAGRNFGYDLKKMALEVAEKLSIYTEKMLKYVEENGKDSIFETDEHLLDGMRLNPHWLGLTTMALALADKATGKTQYYGLIKRYYNVVMDGPPAWDKQSCIMTGGKTDWSISEYCYLTLAATTVAQVYNDSFIRKVACYAGEILLSNQEEDGHFASNHFEAPVGKQFADLIYTQNWATLALQHLAIYMPENINYRYAFEKSVKFLTKIQDKSENQLFFGCWRGMYDCKTKKWGGGDKYEGGQGSIYSGWTNAPICIAFLFELSGKSFI